MTFAMTYVVFLSLKMGYIEKEYRGYLKLVLKPGLFKVPAATERSGERVVPTFMGDRMLKEKDDKKGGIFTMDFLSSQSYTKPDLGRHQR